MRALLMALSLATLACGRVGYEPLTEELGGPDGPLGGPDGPLVGEDATVDGALPGPDGPNMMADGSPDGTQGTCPAVCNAGCGGGVCTMRNPPRIDDGGVWRIECPPDMPCELLCDEPDACNYEIHCLGTSCHLTCTGLSTCDWGIHCGSAACEVDCIGDGSCKGQIYCEDSPDCAIGCGADQACDFGVMCGAGRCSVECTAAGTCDAGTECSGACACDSTCPPEGCKLSGQNQNVCPAGCRNANGSCSSTLPGCDTCP